jgi:Domain of unknown function (DUF1844)
MDEKQEEQAFTVTDKRFSARRDAVQERPSGSSQSGPAATEPQGRAESQAGARAAAGSEEVNFASFLISLGTQAFMHLGDIPNPLTQKREKDIAAAKQMVDLLGILEAKTKGNLTGDEEGLLRQLLFDLRMRYVRETGR